MDFARKINKSNEIRIWQRSRTPFASTKDRLLSDNISFSEDHRLVNWKKWLADRKKQSNRIESVTGRSQSDQLQSRSEEFRAFVEMRDLMEYAAISEVTDELREETKFWKAPEFLSDRISLPKVSLTFTKKELNLRPDVTHVGLPDLTANERNLTVLRANEEFWKRSEHLKKRKRELAEKIALLLPKKPETAMLAVKGHAIREKKPQLRVPLISITGPNEEPLRENQATTVFKIQDREFFRENFLPNDVTMSPVDTSRSIVWSLIFESKIGERVEKDIIFENKGTRVVVYHWRNSSFLSTDVSFETRGSPFFFNKTTGLVLPGQVAEIKIWYRPRIHSIFTESWQLVTEPKLNPSALVFRFWGCTIDITTSLTVRMIDEYLDRCVRDSAIKSVVEEITAGVKYRESPKSPLYKTLFLKNELFSSLNPSYFYHPSIVMRLQEMYRDNVIDDNAPSWDLSFDILRNIFMQIEKTNRRSKTLARFYELCKQSLRPNLYDDSRNYKIDSAYDVLCAFTNLFERESEFVNIQISIKEKPVTYALEISADKQMSSALSSPRSNDDPRGTSHVRSIDQLPNIPEKSKSFYLDLRARREAFFIRVYKALGETIERICAIVDSFNALYESDKLKSSRYTVNNCVYLFESSSNKDDKTKNGYQM